MKQRLQQLFQNKAGFLQRRSGISALYQDSYNAFESSGDELSLQSGSLDGLSAHSGSSINNIKSRKTNKKHLPIHVPTADQIDQTTDKHVLFGKNNKNNYEDDGEEDPTEEPTEKDDEEEVVLSVPLFVKEAALPSDASASVIIPTTPPRSNKTKLSTRSRRSPRSHQAATSSTRRPRRRGGRRLRAPPETRERISQVAAEQQQKREEQSCEQQKPNTKEERDDAMISMTNEPSVKKDQDNEDDSDRQDTDDEFFHFDAATSDNPRKGLMHQSKHQAVSFQHRRQRHILLERQLSFPHHTRDRNTSFQIG